MTRIHNIIKNIFRCLGAGILSLLILSIFTIFYSYSGTHIDNLSGETDYKWIAGQHRSIATEGFSWSRVDENGFNNINIKSMDAIDVLLMGSSHMEAFNVPQDRTTAAILNFKHGDDLYTYNIGISGHDLYRCVKNIEAAVSKYKPTKYVIIETSNIKMDIDKIDLVLQGKLNKIKSYDSGLLYQFQKVPSLKWLYKQIETLLINSASAQNSTSADAVDYGEEYAKKIDGLLKMMRASMHDSNSQLIIVYHPVISLTADGLAYSTTEENCLEIFDKACEHNEIIFVDMTDDFLYEYNKQYILPHGFSNTAVGSGHLNEDGHRMIAERLYDITKTSSDNRGGVK